jgi:hypothetical protein
LAVERDFGLARTSARRHHFRSRLTKTPAAASVPGQFVCPYPTKDQNMRNLPDCGPLFQWARNQEIRRHCPPLVRRVARRARISDLHALAFCIANGITGHGAP